MRTGGRGAAARASRACRRARRGPASARARRRSARGRAMRPGPWAERDGRPRLTPSRARNGRGRWREGQKPARREGSGQANQGLRAARALEPVAMDGAGNGRNPFQMNVPRALAVRVVDLEVVAPRASADHLERVGPVQGGPELEFQRVPRLTALFVDGTRDLAVLRSGDPRIAEAAAAWLGQEQR